MADPRLHQRLLVALRVRLQIASAEIEATTENVSLAGLSVRLPTPPAVDESVGCVIHLPNAGTVAGTATCKSIADDRVGFALALDEENLARWRAFLDEETNAGNLWHLLGRFASTSGEEKEAVRSVLEQSAVGVLFKRVIPARGAPAKTTTMHFHVVGENGEAYRVAFEKHGGAQPENSDLVSLPGFKALAVKVGARVLKEDVVLRRDPKAPPLPVRVVELLKGGYAAVNGGKDGVPVNLVSLSVGEMILVEKDGAPVFPGFTPEDLERIACDTYRKEEKPRVTTTPAPEPAPETPPPTEASGLEALRAEQDRSPRASRRYDDRVIDVFPEVWVQAVLGDGEEVMGPTMRDGDRLLVLVLEGPASPRIAKLEAATRVVVLNAAVARS